MTPETSTTLLRDISSDADSSRWPEFVARYRPMMLAFLKTHFPSVDADEMVQETLIALAKALPHYRYAPDETGRFRNYLTGILRNRALKWCKRVERDRALKTEMRKNAVPASLPTLGNDDDEWRKALLEIAMHQLLADKQIPDKSKQIFQRLTVDGMAPEDVAIAYGTSRSNIYQTKSRMISRLREIVQALEAAADV